MGKQTSETGRANTRRPESSVSNKNCPARPVRPTAIPLVKIQEACRRQKSNGTYNASRQKHTAGRWGAHASSPGAPHKRNQKTAAANVQVEPVPSVRPSVYGPMRACPSRPPSPAGTVDAAAGAGGGSAPPRASTAGATASAAVASGGGAGASAIPQRLLDAGEHAAAYGRAGGVADEADAAAQVGGVRAAWGGRHTDEVLSGLRGLDQLAEWVAATGPMA